MLVVTGIVEVNEAGIEQAREAAQAMVAETVKEPGCLVYEFSQVLGHPNRFRVYEEWESQEALEAHFAKPHMATFRAALGEVGLISRDLCTITGGEKQPFS